MAVYLIPDILINIFKYATYLDVEKVTAWKDQLELLAVCHEWRHIGIPFVYRHVYVTCIWDEYSNNYSRLTDDISPEFFRTNADIVEASGYSELVKNMVFYVNYSDSPMGIFAKLVSILACINPQWNSVKCITVVDKSHDIYWDSDGEGDEDEDEDVLSFISALASDISVLAPNVSNLVVHPDYDYNVDTKELYGQLARKYCNQMKRLSISHCGLYITGEPKFTQLTHLKLNFSNSRSCKVPLATTKMLQSVVLTGIPANHSWLSIDRRDLPKTIEFTNLRTLSLLHTGDNSNGPALDRTVREKWLHIRVHFPKLNQFYTNDDSDELPIIATAVFPPHMDILEIEAADKLLKLLAMNDTLPDAKYLTLTVPDNETKMKASVFSSIRYVFQKSAETSVVAKLLINNSTLSVKQRSLVSMKVTYLRIEAPVEYVTLLSLIRNLPELTDLSVIFVYPGNVPAAIVDSRQKRLQPFNSNIQDLALDYSEYEFPAECAIEVVAYMAKRLPKLKAITTVSSAIPAVELLSSQVDVYPHLCNFVFKYLDSNDMFPQIITLNIPDNK